MTTKPVLPRCTPESQGIPSASILAFIDDLEQNIHHVHSFMLLRHGAVVAEGWWSPYGPEHPHMLFSLTKSFTSTAIGMAVAEGRLSVEDPVLPYFPKDAPRSPGENLKAMRIRHLLSMSTGHDKDTTAKMVRRKNWARAFLSLPVEHEPGTHFVYNSGASYMLSAIVQKVTGMTLQEYLTPRLFEPLSIREASWETCPRGFNIGGWGLSLRTEDIARFGQLCLQKGAWDGKQILPAGWVEQASSKQVSNGSSPDSDWEQGYGYQFWRCRHDTYRGDGAFGQYCIIMPGQDTVLAITSGVGDMQAVLNVVWKRLLPAMQTTTLPEDPHSQESLMRKLSSLEITPVNGEAGSTLAEKNSGKKFYFEQDRGNRAKIEWAALYFKGDGCTITIRDAGGEHRIACGCGAWSLGETRFQSETLTRVAASGCWTAPHTFCLSLCFYETPFITTCLFQFAGDELRLDIRDNVAFRPVKRPALVGKAAL